MRISNFRKSIVFALAVLALAACNNDTELRWTEEIKLADGRIIVVKRYSEFKAPHEIGQPSGESYTRLEFEHPATREAVKFESKLSADSVEMVEAGKTAEGDSSIMQRPYAVFLKTNKIFLLTKPQLSIYPFYGCPDPPFFLYLWESGRWQRQPLTKIPQRSFFPNLTTDPLLTREKIRSNNQHLAADEVTPSEISYGPLEIDLSGMTQQTFELPPNCSSCTMTVPTGNRADSPVAGPFCTRNPRDWLARKHLTN